MKSNVLLLCLALTANTFAADYTVGKWRLNVSSTTGVSNVYKDNTLVLSHNKSTFKLDGAMYDLTTLQNVSVTDEAVSDKFGSGRRVDVRAKVNDTVDVCHSYFLYEGVDYILTRLTLTSSSGIIRSNYMSPVVTTSAVNLLSDGDNRQLFVPFDNDEWIRYQSNAFGNTTNSYEVGAIYSADTHEGIVVGSIEHTQWKSVIISVGEGTNTLKSLTATAGASDWCTRDILPHGAVCGTTVSSPLFMVGMFDDWRTGMETFGDLCVVMAPKMPWDGGKPFVWNSWGVLQTSVRYMNASQSALFIADSLMSRGYQNNGTMYMDLDSYWDNLTGSDLRRFTHFCSHHGQKAGIYWTPFVDWANNPDRIVEGTTDVKYKDIWLYANGQPVKRTGATACDPTHPGTKTRMVHFMNNFHTWGYEFLKIDFMDHGILEADSWYDKNVTTGVEAYCQGMAYLDSLTLGKMYLNLSIAPLFPAQFAHGRRIACDAYGSIGNSEYTLNSTTYGWWLDHVYHFNDPDNIVFKGQDIKTNRVRLASALVTGMLCLGDDYSNSGDDDAKERAKQLIDNPSLIQMARETGSFRPLNTKVTGNSASDTYYTMVADTCYVAVFNWGGRKAKTNINFSDLGISTSDSLLAEELFFSSAEYAAESVDVTVPALDCRILKIYKGTIKPETAIDNLKVERFTCSPNPTDSSLRLSLPDVNEVFVYSACGSLVARYGNVRKINVSHLAAGTYLIRALGENTVYTSEFIKK
ncbi:MAG: T9SS type A sorting domain-containing protein [Paludibacteraceae bacterium]|nr:T9SS type A sorting domain-containing protein [Paludibacteraceae bacterium]